MSELVKTYLLKNPTLEKIILFKSSFLKENLTKMHRYIGFPYISKDKQLIWNKDKLIFNNKDEFINFCNELRVKQVCCFGD